MSDGEIIEIGGILDAERHLDGIEGVVFDLDDTLYPERAYVQSGFAAVACAFPEWENAAERLWFAFEAGRPAIDAVFEEEDRAKALAAYRAHTPEIEPYPGVADMIERLRRAKRVGIVTDGRPEGQRAKLGVLGMNELVSDIVITDELGGIEFRKPNPAAFQKLQAQWGIPFASMAYIGDNMLKDFQAPQALGMRCVWFNNSEGLYSRERQSANR